MTHKAIIYRGAVYRLAGPQQIVVQQQALKYLKSNPPPTGSKTKTDTGGKRSWWKKLGDGLKFRGFKSDLKNLGPDKALKNLEMAFGVGGNLMIEGGKEKLRAFKEQYGIDQLLEEAKAGKKAASVYGPVRVIPRTAGGDADLKSFVEQHKNMLMGDSPQVDKLLVMIEEEFGEEAAQEAAQGLLG